MKVIVHIGANKTGSTAIQRYLSQNRKALLHRGILWPQTGLQGGAHYELSSWLGFSHGGQALNEQALEARRCEFHDEIAQSGARLAILSSEFFMLKRALERFQYFFEGIDLRVVVVLRRHDTWWPSLWAQAIKTVQNPPWGRSFESYLEFQTRKSSQFIGYRELVENWDRVCNGKLRAVPYETSQMPRGIIPAFLNAVGLAEVAESIQPDTRMDNVSQRVDVLSLVDFLQRTRQIPPERKQVLIAGALSCQGTGQTLGAFISGHMRRKLALEHLGDYGFLDRRFSQPARKQFFEDPLPDDDGQKGPHLLPPVSAIELLVNEVIGGN